jgi:hypothetical protein
VRVIMRAAERVRADDERPSRIEERAA